MISLGVPLALSLRDRVNAEVHSQALSQADIVAASSADLLSPPRTRELELLVHSSGASVRGRVLVVDRKGLVLADSASTNTLGSSYLSRPEIATALAGRAVQTQRASHSLGQNILATAVPVVHNQITIGAVRITQSVDAVQSAVNSTITKLVLVAGTVLALGLLAGAMIARQVALPIKRLEGAARRISEGELSARAVLEGSSEQRSLSTSFNEMAERNQRLIAAQRQFIADASHQLRTPLTGLRLRLEEAMALGPQPSLAAELRAGTAEVDRLASILDELLVLSRAEDRELPGEAVELSDALLRAAKRWGAVAQARGIELVTVAGQEASAWCARADLDRALDVLIENSLHYSPPGSEVMLRTAERRIEILDRGPGLALGEQQLVFERFHRGSAGRQGPPGSGLGLAIARTLARAWHGEVHLVNRSGGGAVASLEFAGSER